MSCKELVSTTTLRLSLRSVYHSLKCIETKICLRPIDIDDESWYKLLDNIDQMINNDELLHPKDNYEWNGKMIELLLPSSNTYNNHTI